MINIIIDTHYLFTLLADELDISDRPKFEKLVQLLDTFFDYASNSEVQTEKSMKKTIIHVDETFMVFFR